MDQVFNGLLHDRSYEELLGRTDAVLATSPLDSTALAFKGRALACLRRYSEACETLLLAAKQPGPAGRREKIKELERNCRKLVTFEQRFVQYTGEVLAFPIDWYRQRLLSAVSNTETDATERGLPNALELFPYNSLSPGTSYILGPAALVDKFNGFEYVVYARLKSSPYGFPLTQGDGQGYLYHKDQTFQCPYGMDKKIRRRYGESCPQPVALFPTVEWEVNDEKVQVPNSECDVFVGNGLVDEMTQSMLQWSLDILSKQTQDFLVPMYQHIIDPNLTPMQVDGRNQWTATDFIMENLSLPKIDVVCALQGCIRRIIGRGLPWHSVELILSHLDSKDKRYFRSLVRAHLAAPISNLNPMENKELYVAVEAVLTAAAPLLAKLRKPALLLPGKLQAVVKAQRIYLQPGEEYTGVWHADGLNEDIVAVVLYYYRYSHDLEGGDLEFMSRRPRKEEFWLHGDCSPDSFTPSEAQEFVNELPHCRVPVKKGTLVVFSNYQLVHRVLRMASPTSATGDASAPGGLASRDFLVLFIVDQRSPLKSTRDLPTIRDQNAAESIRCELLFKQLEPAGKFGVSGDLAYSTGNGSVALLGWMESYQSDADTEYGGRERDRSGLAALKTLNVPPPLGRGVSWALEKDSWVIEDEWSMGSSSSNSSATD